MTDFIDVKMCKLPNGNIVRAWKSQVVKNKLNFHFTNTRGEETYTAFSKEALEVMKELSDLLLPTDNTDG